MSVFKYMLLAALTIAIACYIAFWPIRFRNCRMQNYDARLVFEERKFCHITPLLRAPPPHFYTFEAPSPPLPHFYRFPPPTPHFYCFPSNTTTTFHCFPPTRTHTISTFLLFSIHLLHHNCFHCTTISTTSRLFSLHPHLHQNSIVFRPQLQHHLISIVFHPQPPTHFYGFSSATFTTFLLFPCTTTSTTFLLFSIHHHDHISIVFLFPLHQYQISKLPPPEPPPSNFYVFFISMLTHQNEEKNRFGQRRAREWK